jgi:hypothetical protein
MGGFGSIFGLLLQIVLIVIVARLIFVWWQRRNVSIAPSYAGTRPATSHSFSGRSGIFNGASAPRTGQPLSIVKSDYDEFERLLGDMQVAYSTENLPTLRALVTPEMVLLLRGIGGQCQSRSGQSRH